MRRRIIAGGIQLNHSGALVKGVFLLIYIKKKIPLKKTPNFYYIE